MHGEAQPYCMPIRPCFGWGLPSHAIADVLVRSYRTFSAFLLTPEGASGSLSFFSALSIGFPLPGR